MAQIPKGSLVKGPYTPICRDCAIYFSSTVDTRYIRESGILAANHLALGSAEVHGFSRPQDT